MEGLMLKLKLQYFGHLRRRADSFEKTLMLGQIEDRREGDDRGWDGWMASLTQWTWVWVDSGSWWWTGWPGVLQFMGSQRVGHDWVTELNWTEECLGCFLLVLLFKIWYHFTDFYRRMCMSVFDSCCIETLDDFRENKFLYKTELFISWLWCELLIF